MDLDFNLDEDIPTAIPVWVKLPWFPLSYWSDVCLREIGHGVGRYVDRVEPKKKL